MALSPPHSNMRVLASLVKNSMRPKERWKNKDFFFFFFLAFNISRSLWAIRLYGGTKGQLCLAAAKAMSSQGPAPCPCVGQSLNPFNPKKVGIPCSVKLGTEPTDSFKVLLSHSHVPRKGQNKGRASHCLPRPKRRPSWRMEVMKKISWEDREHEHWGFRQFLGPIKE